MPPPHLVQPVMEVYDACVNLEKTACQLVAPIDPHQVAIRVAGICTDGEEHIVYNVQYSVQLTGRHFKFFNGPIKASSTSLFVFRQVFQIQWHSS